MDAPSAGCFAWIPASVPPGLRRNDGVGTLSIYGIRIIWDNAGFHRSDSLEVPKNITLFPLPPYSPELNPIEIVWYWMRSHHLSNRVYADHDELEEAANDSCSRLAAPRLKTITRTEWIIRSY